MKTVIRKFGSSKGVIIPAPLLAELNLDVNDQVDARVEAGCIIIQASGKQEYSLSELLAQCKPSVAMDEEDIAWLNDSPIGCEVINCGKN